MFPLTDDPHRDFDRHEAELQRQLDRLPKCGYCREPIQDEHAFVINGKCYCTQCINDYHRIRVADYIQ